MSKSAILCVDDEKMVLSSLKEQLKTIVGMEFKIETAESGAEALEICIEFAERQIDIPVVISDYIMPGMRGDELLERIHKISPKTVKILLTGQATLEGVANAINHANLYRYIIKPWEKEDLALTVTEAARSYFKDRLLEQKNEELVEINSILEETVSRRTAAIRNLLNNAGQGFLSFGEDLIVGEEYSVECTKIFQSEIKNKKYTQLVFVDDKSEMDLLENVLIDIFNEKDSLRRESYLSLISGEVMIKDKHICIDYKVINDTLKESSILIMAVLTDVTEKRNLENKLEKENNTLKMIVNAIKYYDEVMECIRNYKDFCKTQAYDIISSGKSLEAVTAELFIKVHTFKGSFSQWHMNFIAEKLHTLETKMHNFDSQIPNMNINDLKSLFEGGNMLKWLEQDLKLLKDNLGEEFLCREDQIVIDKANLLEIERKIGSLLPPSEAGELLHELSCLLYKPFAELLRSYPEYTMQLAERMEKRVNSFKIKGGEFPTDSHNYHDFAKSLVHIFRNSVDHGIEFPEERIEKGKEAWCNITCSIKLLKDKIYICIKDDGCGIDVDKIREQAVLKKLISPKEAVELSDDKIINVIFAQGFSLSENITAISGRGVGLSAVKDEVEKLGGKVRVKSSVDKGTTFCLILPHLH